MNDRWVLAAASVKGPDKERNQDAYAAGILPSGAALAVVADGLSAFAYAEDGARLAVDAIYAWLATQLTREFLLRLQDWHAVMADAARQALQSIQEHAVGHKRNPGDYACTLSCALAWDTGFLTAQIGDGIVVARRRTGETYAASWPQTGDEPNLTYALEPGNLTRTRLVVTHYHHPVTAFAVMTDGVWKYTGQPHPLERLHPNPAFYSAIFDAALETDGSAQLKAILESSKLATLSDDDKTLVAMAVMPGTSNGMAPSAANRASQGPQDHA